jgi:fumarate reductase flavoprotein subunit
MVAAVAVARRGLKVTLLDKGEEPAGNTVRSTGLIPAAGTRFQRDAGIRDDSPELMAEDILAKNGHESDPEITRLLCEESGPLVEWLAEEAGCEMVCFTDFLYPGHSRLRMHGPPTGYGTELAAALGRAVRDEPGIDFFTGVSTSGLAWDGERVSGVETGNGRIEARAVLLALNGFGGNGQMVREHLGRQVAEALYYGSPNNTSEGISWGIELEAATEHMGSYQGHAYVAHPDGPLVTWGVVVNGAILVNRDGRRFGNEMVGYSEFAANILSQPDGEAWEIFDEEVYEASRGTRLEEVIEAGKVHSFDSLRELGSAFGLPSDTLAETVGEANRYALEKGSDPFGRKGFAEGPLEPPFYGIHVRGALFHTQGGLKVDGRARVLRPDGTAILGLYAGGGTAVGVSGSGHAGYSSGNGLLAAAVLGKIAGEDAAVVTPTL